MKYKLLLYSFFFSLTVVSQTVYKTPSGSKYHIGSCRMVKNVSQQITVDQANQLGLQSCKICSPPSFKVSSTNKSNFISNNKAKGESTTVQCKGQTKKGNRCKHRTSIADGFCFQHQSK